MESARIARLREAAGSGEILTIVYDGGSQPGTKRDVIIHRIDGEGAALKVRTRCLSTGLPKLFFVAKLTIVEPDHPAPVYRAKGTAAAVKPKRRKRRAAEPRPRPSADAISRRAAPRIRGDERSVRSRPGRAPGGGIFKIALRVLRLLLRSRRRH